MIALPVDADAALVRRCVVAAVAPQIADMPAARTMRSPAFARVADAALAAGAMPSLAAALTRYGVELPSCAPAGPEDIDARALRTIRDGLRYAHSRSDADARALVFAPGSDFDADDAAAVLVAGTGDLRAAVGRAGLAESPGSREAALELLARFERIAQAYRAQGATAREVVATIVLELRVAGAERAVDVAAALDRAATILGTAWTIEALENAFERELRACAPPGTLAPTPAEPLAPEPARPVAPRRNHYSASSLTMYAECKRKWFFRYLCSAVDDKGSSASFYGTAFHAALEAFHTAYPRIDGIAPDQLARRLEGELNSAFERYRIGFASEVEFRLARRRAQRTARRYLAWLAERARVEPFEVVGCEVAADVSLDGFHFVGYIDRIDRDDRSGRITVIDYKTGTIAESAAEYRANVAAGREFQLPYYFWAQTQSGEVVRSIALVPLKDASIEVEPIELEIVPGAPRATRAARDEAARGTIGLIELERARTAMVEICRTLASATIERWPATDDPSACRYCVYAPACRERPPSDDGRFGR